MDTESRFGIVIPLRSPATTARWDACCNALEATLRSIARQTIPVQKVYLVGHEMPSFLGKYPFVRGVVIYHYSQAISKSNRILPRLLNRFARIPLTSGLRDQFSLDRVGG
jgi:hypothetical protein